MHQPRCTSLWSLLGVLTCVSIVFTASLVLYGGDSRREVPQRISHSPHLPKPPTELSVAAPLPAPPEDLREEDVSFAEKSPTVESGRAATEPVQSAGTAEAFAPPRKIDTQVIAASAVEDAMPHESGPNLTASSEAPGEATVERPVAPAVVRRPAAQAAAAPPEHPAGGPTSKLSLLPEWLRHLPEIVASIPEAILDPSPATKPTAKATPTPQPKPAPATAPAAMPEPATKPQPTTEKVDDSWREPEALIENLNELTGGPAGKWAVAVLRQVAALKPAVAAGSDEATAILDRLDQLSQQTLPLTVKLSDRAFARKWRETGYALARRVNIWRQVVRLEKTEASAFLSPALDPQKLADCLADAEAATNDSAEGKQWQAFLLFDDLRRHCMKQSPRNERLSREVAGRALARMTQIPLTPEQQRFISSPPLTALRLELWCWAARPIGAAQLLRDVERYEWTCLPSDARRLAINCQDLSVSQSEIRRQLAARVNAHYRNANMRFLIAEEFLNDLIPEQKAEYRQINETVTGRPVQGNSLAENRIAVRMVPDPHRALLALEVSGEIAALTNVNAGMAQFQNESESRYIARKLLEITMDGIVLEPNVDVNVQSETRLSGMQTSVNRVPLIGWIARTAARQQHDSNLPAATEETKQKIADRVTDRINTETRQRFSEVVDRLNQRVFDPLNSLAIAPELIDAQTTEKWFVMRLRVGGEDQLGSHTPRPPEVPGSLASLQIHESVINNGIQRLRLDGASSPCPNCRGTSRPA